VRAVLGGMGWTAEPPTARGQVRDRWESWQALATQAEEFAAEHGSGADLTAFVADLDRRAAEQHAPAADGVTLATFHAAKGLEWDAVFCARVQDGTVPITYADRDATVEEERRLLYVGMTRARHDLTVTWAAARNPGQAARRQPSRFLTPLLPERDLPQPGRARSKVARCRECSQPLGTAAEKKRGRCAHHPVRYDESLYERLKAWRLERARDDEVPAYVVFTDATLELIAEHKPGDERALRAISGVGPSKIEKYGDDVLALVTSEA
jgi:DNA helicase-2/ATP-dependent DNA helicase PcrA